MSIRMYLEKNQRKIVGTMRGVKLFILVNVTYCDFLVDVASWDFCSDVPHATLYMICCKLRHFCLIHHKRDSPTWV